MQNGTFRTIRSPRDRLSEEAERLRKEARGTPPGVEREGVFAGRGLRKPPPT